MNATPQQFSVAPTPPLFFFHCRLLWVSLVILTIIDFLVSTARVFLLTPPHVFICIFLFDRPLGGGFLVLRGRCALGLIPERLGLMAFALVPGWIKDRGWGFFFTIASATRSFCSQ